MKKAPKNVKAIKSTKKNYYIIVCIMLLLCITSFFLGYLATKGANKKVNNNTTPTSTVNEGYSEPVLTIKQGVYKTTHSDGTVSIMAIFNDHNCAKYNHITNEKANSITTEDLRYRTRTEDYCRWQEGQTWGYETPQDDTGYSLRYHPYVDEYTDETGARVVDYEIRQQDDYTIMQISKNTNEILIFTLIRGI
ncbi:MAG: hypothetical protein MJZ22_01865 [Candidatus Saccharibacteria bacterium]|nr:hypothetical protein [Candidatus Saccharibacteria bacterium]